MRRLFWGVGIIAAEVRAAGFTLHLRLVEPIEVDSR
jgi:hypothetical protein